MSWVLIAAIAYLLIALQVILDKFMLSSKRVAHPATFAFYTGILSFFTLFVFLPFGGIHLVSLNQFWLLIVSGIIFIFGALYIFFAIQKNQASQVIPVAGAVTPIVTYLLSLAFLQEKLSALNLLGIAGLILGGLLISFDLPLKVDKSKFFAGFFYSVLGGFFLGVAFLIFKIMYEQDNFANVFVWTRMGLGAGALVLLLIPPWKEAILDSFKNLKNNPKENSRTSVLFVFNKILGGTGSLMLNWAIALGSVTIANAMVSVEYIFVFILGLIFAFWLPKIFREKATVWDIFQKVGAISIITAGIVLISRTH